MSDVRRSRRARAGLLAAAALTVPSLLVGSASAEPSQAPTDATEQKRAVPAGDCPSDLVQHVKEVPDVVAGTVIDLDEDAVDADTREITLSDVETINGDVEGGGDIVIKTDGEPSGGTPKPTVNARYVVLLSPTNDDGEAAAFGARLCDFIPAAQERKVADAVLAVQREAAEAEDDAAADDDTAAVNWDDLDAGYGTDYGAAVLPGVLIAAIGALGLAGTVLLSAVIGRRRSD